MSKRRLFTIVGIVFLFFTTIFTLLEIYKNTNQNNLNIKLKNEQIIKATNSFLEYLKSDTSKKVDMLLANENVKKAFYEKNRKMLYKHTSPCYKRQKALNPFLKIMSFRLPDGSTFLRVHKPEMYGDKLNKKRKIILDTNRIKKRHYGFEIGKLKMTYRVVTPIFYKDQHIGLVEVGIEPEYLIDKLNKTFEHIQSGLIVKKDMLNVHSEKVKNPKTIGKNYILARGDEIFNRNRELLCPTSDIVLTYKKHDYIVSSDLNLYDHKNNIAAKLLFSYEIQSFKERLYDTILLTIGIIFVLMVSLFIIINFVFNKFANIIQEQKDEIQTILDASSGIIVVSNGTHILNANLAFFNFFSEFKSLEDFKKVHDCVCDSFERVDKEDYIPGKTVNGMNWTKYILKHGNSVFKAMIKKYNGQEHHFLINVKEVNLKQNDFIVVELSDITLELEHQKELEHKQKIFQEQSKHAAMGEMIGNIAHQWRQPLSIISTSATGMQLNNDMGLLDQKMVHNSCEIINKNAQYLSKTIDDFRDFIKGDSKKTIFNLSEDINSFLRLIEGSIKFNEIKMILDLQNHIEINGYQNELTQCFMNIYNNAKDAFIKKDIKNKYIFIDTAAEKETAVIRIKDNAGGIPDDVLPHIFEPYFSTKHQSQGTGLGLSMTFNLIVDGMNGTIEAQNITYEHNGKGYKGAEFKITLPLE